MSFNRSELLWLRSGTASTHHLYGGSPEEINLVSRVDSYWNGMHKIKAAVDRMLTEAQPEEVVL